MNLPTGTITFLFTDIEGSTHLWEEYPNAMRAALEQHDNLLRMVIEAHNGYVFKTVGDAFWAAFAAAPEAVRAALEAQRTLAAAEWGATGLLRVRMGLHTGAATERNNDYYGPTVNRAVRIQAIGHGQQILLSQATHKQVARSIPHGASLIDLGRHRLKDLAEPENVWQVGHPELPSEYPSLRSLDYLNTNLGQQLSSFVGREKEMREVRECLQQSSLLTLTGSAGCGKTRLAVHVGADALDQYPDGVWVVELASLTDPALVQQMVAQTLNVREVTGETLIETLISALKDRQMLLILDNCEHLRGDCARLVETFLESCPRLKVLATSREALAVAGERIYLTPSLSVPPRMDTRSRAITVENLMEYESVRLFQERAVAAKMDFKLTSKNAPSLIAVCNRLDGIPLAIELAAVRVRAMPIEQIESRLDSRFRLLTGGPRDALPRQQTLRALIDWSYELLSAPEQALLNRLAVFSGGWTLDAAESVCDRDEGRVMKDEKTSKDSEESAGASVFSSSLIPRPSSLTTLDGLTSLCDKSLVLAEQDTVSARYRLLESVRQYALDRLIESGELDQWRDRHLTHFVKLVESAGDRLTGAEQEFWLGRLETEYDNLRVAFDHSVKQNEIESGLSLVGSMGRFWMTRGQLTEGRRWCTEVLQNTDSQPPSKLLAKAVHTAGNLAYVQADYEPAKSYFEKAALMRNELGDRAGEAGSRLNLANISQSEGMIDLARRQFEQALKIFEDLDDTYGMSVALGCLGSVTASQQDFNAALNYLGRAIEASRKLGSLSAESNNLNNLGSAYRQINDEASARRCFQDALAIDLKLGYALQIGLTQLNLSLSLLYEDDLAGARDLLLGSIERLEIAGARGYISSWLEAMALLEERRNRPDRAVRLLSAAAAHRAVMNIPLPSVEARAIDPAREALFTTLGQQSFTRAYEEGQGLDAHAAIEYALNGE